MKVWNSAGGWRQRFESNGLCWDGDIFLSAAVMIVGIREACHMGGWKTAHSREGSEVKPGD